MSEKKHEHEEEGHVGRRDREPDAVQTPPPITVTVQSTDPNKTRGDGDEPMPRGSHRP